MLRNICYDFTNTQHKSSRKIRPKKDRVYAAVLREPQHMPYFFYKIPPSFIHHIQNPRKYILFSKRALLRHFLIYLFIFFNPLLQAVKIFFCCRCCCCCCCCSSSSSSSSTFNFFKTHENFCCCCCCSSEPTQLFRASFF